MLSMRNRINIDSFVRIMFICALIAVAMSMVFVSNLKAETSENALDKKSRGLNPKQDSTTPGDADDVTGKIDLQIQQEYIGNGDYPGPSRSSMNAGTNGGRIQRIINFLFYHYIMLRGIIILNR